ncbi:uncharacterized protein TNCV_764311 [Trichonephila clavipes]|nr:uncharacterized protein TNCV_764311 [Trichonephila clavipes]
MEPKQSFWLRGKNRLRIFTLRLTGGAYRYHCSRQKQKPTSDINKVLMGRAQRTSLNQSPGDESRGFSTADSHCLGSRACAVLAISLRCQSMFSKLQEDLDQKISGFEMDIRLEPLAGRLKKQEKLLKEIFLKIRVLECQSMGPIEVKRYVHCEDGKRVKPLQKQMTQWNQSELSFFGSDKLLEENIADQIEADVEKRLEDAIFRDSKYYLKGLNLQAKATKT